MTELDWPEIACRSEAVLFVSLCDSSRGSSAEILGGISGLLWIQRFTQPSLLTKFQTNMLVRPPENTLAINAIRLSRPSENWRE